MCVCVCLCDLIGKVELVGMVHQAAPEPESQLTLQEADGTVDEGGGHSHQEPLGQLHHEGLRVLLHDALHDQTYTITTSRGQQRQQNHTSPAPTSRCIISPGYQTANITARRSFSSGH